MGYISVKGAWVKKQEREYKNIPSDSKVKTSVSLLSAGDPDLLENLASINEKLTAIKDSLTSMQITIEDVHGVAKETSSNVYIIQYKIKGESTITTAQQNVQLRVGEPAVIVPKTRKEYNDVDRKAVEKNFRAKNILVCGIGPDEYNRISACQSTKEIWEALQTAHEGTTQVKQSKIDMLTTEYELFKIKDDESIKDMHTRFTSIINELHSLGEIIPRNKLVRKVLNVLPAPGRRKNDSERREPKKEKNLVLKAENDNSSEEDSDMAYLTRRFQKIVRRNGAWGDSSSESEEENNGGDNSMLVVESEANEYDSIFALMAQSDDDEDDDNDEVNFRDVHRNLKSYSPKKLMSLANVLIDAYHSLETIENLKNEKEVITEKIASVEHERDDLMVVVVDLKETIENLSKEKNALVEKVAITEQERDDLLVVIADPKEIIEEHKADSRPGSSKKGKEITSEANIKLENELNIVKTSLCAELEKNRQLQAELEKVKNNLEKSLKWTWSSDAITAMYFNNGRNRRGIGFQRGKVPYNPHRKYVTVPDNWLCTHCGKNGHFTENCQARGTVRGSSQQWIMDSGCSKHMTRNTMDFFSLKALQGGNASFGNGKKGYILGVGKIGKSLSHSIENMYYVNGLKYNLLIVSQICDKGNKVEFLSKICTVTNLVTSEVKDLVRGLPNSKFKEHKVCDACAREKHVKSSIKTKKDVSTSKPLELLHMDLCGPMRVPSRGGKRYIFVIVDDCSRFTWALFLRTKDETFEVFVAFVKKIQVKMESKVACIRSDHGTEFDNAKFDEFCSGNSITHNFSAPRTPQQNGVV
ncbi:intracellular protein transport protein USO1-like [Nicotiana tomentosiformis]|uniref:intracellular protein transport protein USO1-like n=1 Tax=Nicotiana tomentosiformis TaxID=4098 RepID=UPI00388C79AE